MEDSYSISKQNVFCLQYWCSTHHLAYHCSYNYDCILNICLSLQAKVGYSIWASESPRKWAPNFFVRRHCGYLYKEGNIVWQHSTVVPRGCSGLYRIRHTIAQDHCNLPKAIFFTTESTRCY